MPGNARLPAHGDTRTNNDLSYTTFMLILLYYLLLPRDTALRKSTNIYDACIDSSEKLIRQSQFLI